MIFGIQEKQEYEKETRCWICKGEFNDIHIHKSNHQLGYLRLFVVYQPLFFYNTIIIFLNQKNYNCLCSSYKI